MEKDTKKHNTADNEPKPKGQEQYPTLEGPITKILKSDLVKEIESEHSAANKKELNNVGATSVKVDKNLKVDEPTSKNDKSSVISDQALNFENEESITFPKPITPKMSMVKSPNANVVMSPKSQLRFSKEKMQGLWKQTQQKIENSQRSFKEAQQTKSPRDLTPKKELIQSMTSSQHEKMVEQSNQVLRSTMVDTNVGQNTFHPGQSVNQGAFRQTQGSKFIAVEASIIEEGKVINDSNEQDIKQIGQDDSPATRYAVGRYDVDGRSRQKTMVPSMDKALINRGSEILDSDNHIPHATRQPQSSIRQNSAQSLSKHQVTPDINRTIKSSVSDLRSVSIVPPSLPRNSNASNDKEKMTMPAPPSSTDENSGPNAEENNILLSESVKKEDLDHSIYVQDPLSVLKTIADYVYSDIEKKARSFKIGVFTIFLVVCFISLLKSMVDVAPIAFLKVGQDQGGKMDFTITSNFGDPSINGDINMYSQDYFEYEPTNVGGGLFDQILGSAPTIQDNTDQLSLFGFNLINFYAYQDQLDELSKTDTFQGFSPRWLLPMKLRNITEPARNTSVVLLVIDSQREIDNDMVPFFIKQPLGDSEIMVSDKALQFLDVSRDRKEKVEVVFDFGELLNTISSVSGGFSAPSTESIEEQVNEQVGNILTTLLPDAKQVGELLKAQGLNVTDNGEVELDISSLLNQFIDPTQFQNITLPAFDFQDAFPNLNLTFLDDLNITLPNLNATQIQNQLQGIEEIPINLNITSILEAIDNSNLTTIKLPISDTLDSLSQIDYIPSMIGHNFTVVESFNNSAGKFPEALGNVMLIDCKSAPRLLETTYDRFWKDMISQNPTFFLFLNNIDVQVRETIKNINFCQYSMTIEGTLSDQITTYTTSRDMTDQYVGSAGNQITQALTLSANITIATPLKTQLKSVELITVFMNTILSTIIIFLGILSVQLIYSLMLSDVEEKSYEFGMLRALGFNTDNIMVTIIMQAITFSVPGVISGLMLAGVFNYLLRDFLFTVTNNSSTYSLSINSVYIGVFIGTVLPLVSNIIPIKKALGKNLRNSLDMNHRASSEMIISVKNMSEMGLSPAQLVFSIMLIFGGIATYYVAPVAFLFGKFEIFFLIMNGVLIFMIIGLTFISILLFPALQNILIRMFLCCNKKDRKLYAVISKNLQAHKTRNQKTAIMFSICLSFLFFAGSTFQLIGNLIKSQLESVVGADLHAFTIDTRSMTSFIDEAAINEFLQQQKEFDGAVKDWTYSSVRLENIFQKILPDNKQQNFFSDAAGYKPARIAVQSTSRNYLQIMNLDYYLPNEFEPGLIEASESTDDETQKVNKLSNGQYDVFDALYSNLTLNPFENGPDQHDIVVTNNEDQIADYSYLDEIKILISEGFRDVLSMDTSQIGRLCVGDRRRCNRQFRVKPRAMATNIPSWFFTAYQNVQFFSQGLVTSNQFKIILNDFLDTYPESKDNYDKMIDTWDFEDDIPKLKLYVKLDENISRGRQDFIANGIRSFFRDDRCILFDLKDTMKQIQNSILLFQIFVVIIGVIGLTLAFFLLLISATQNVKENVWEYGCLRAMGYTKAQGMRTFMYEQYSTVIAALILGSLVGVILSSVVTAQFFLFLERPFTFDAPMYLLYIMTVLSMLTTGYAVFVPVREVNNKRIATVLKGLD